MSQARRRSWREVELLRTGGACTSTPGKPGRSGWKSRPVYKPTLHPTRSHERHTTYGLRHAVEILRLAQGVAGSSPARRPRRDGGSSAGESTCLKRLRPLGPVGRPRVRSVARGGATSPTEREVAGSSPVRPLAGAVAQSARALTSLHQPWSHGPNHAPSRRTTGLLHLPNLEARKSRPRRHRSRGGPRTSWRWTELLRTVDDGAHEAPGRPRNLQRFARLVPRGLCASHGAGRGYFVTRGRPHSTPD